MFERIYDDERKITGRLNHSIVFNLLSSYFKNKFKLKTRGFSGVRTILRLRCYENQKLQLDFHTTSGKAKLIAVNKNKEITQLAEQDFSGIVTTIFEAGIYRFRLVGIKADVEVHIERL